MKSEWTDKLRNRLEHHKMDAPAGLWEDISQEMARTHQTRQQRTMFFTRAAAIAIIVLASALFLHRNYINVFFHLLSLVKSSLVKVLKS